MQYELLTNLFFALVPIALFVIGLSWALKRANAEESQEIGKMEKESEKMKSDSKSLYKEMNKCNNDAQTLTENLTNDRKDLEDTFLNLATKAASPVTIKRKIGVLKCDEKSLKNFLTTSVEEIEYHKELALEGATRNAPFQFNSSNNGISKSMGAATVMLAILFGGCSSNGSNDSKEAQAEFVYEIVDGDITGSFDGSIPTSITPILILPSATQVSLGKYKIKGTVINNRRIQESFTESIDYAEGFWDRKDRDRIMAQKAYRAKIDQGWIQFLDGVDKNLGESYIFPSIKVNCNELAKSGAQVKRLHLYSDMLPSSPAFDIGDHVRNPQVIFKNGKAEEIIRKIDEHFYEHSYEDWSGITIIVHYNPPKEKDELFAAAMQLIRIWVESHNARLIHQVS